MIILKASYYVTGKKAIVIKRLSADWLQYDSPIDVAWALFLRLLDCSETQVQGYPWIVKEDRANCHVIAIVK